MMVRLMSDLHLEFGPLTLEPAGEDVLVLAGDIGIATQGGEWALETGQRLGVPVVMIAGNHEFYDGHKPRGDMESVYADLHDLAAKSDGALTFLQNEAATIKGVRFVGSTMWTDFNLFGKQSAAMDAASWGMNDYRRINTTAQSDFSPRTALEQHQRARVFLGLETGSTLPTVVVTHHAPSRKSVAGRYARDDYSPAYASNLDDLVANSKAALWIHGHVHFSFDYKLGDTRIRTNPRGYFGHEENPEFDPSLVIEIAA